MQQLLHGIEHLQDALSESRKVLLVCDSSFPFLNIKNDIECMGVPYVVFDQFTPNPLYEDVCKGVDLFQITKCDTILAVGGGSSMDVAKCIKLYCQMDKDRLYLDQECKDTGVKLIAIPTTAGTGSESTRYAVIYHGGKKQSVTHESIIPNVAILEPKVLKTLPLYQKKCTMLDALCQGIESWWSVNSSEKSKKLSKEAVESIMKWWREYIFENTDESARQIMYAANLAGQAICITQTTAVHAFSYKITSLYNMPHGHAVAVGLPEIWQYMIDHMEKCIDSRGSGYLSSTFLSIATTMGSATPQEAISNFRDMMQDMDMPNPISEISHRTSDIEVLSTSVNPVRLKNNPIELNEEAIKFLYEMIIK
jgi:alcohol dehydrogenase class IV